MLKEQNLWNIIKIQLYMNTKQIKETEAIVRNEAWAKLTPEQQLASLD